jgi:hypothetical protein
MGKYSFQSRGKSYTVVAGSDISPEQARAIFDQQAASGSLVGLQPGDTLSASTQAAQGLESAQAGAAQNFAASGQTLGQGLRKLAGSVGNAVKSVGKGLVSAVSKVGSSLGTAVTKIGQVLGSVPLGNGITVGDFAVGTTALLGIGGMNQSQTTGALAQVSNDVNQPAGAVSNGKGLGKYGLTINQLESAGYVRPGNAALVNAANTPVSILKSPAAWTGKDGINSLDDMLANEKLQSKIQQTTMVQGLAGLAAVGLAVGGGSDAITTAALALTAAKGIQAAAAYFKEKPIPNDPNGAVKAEFDNTVRNSAYAVTYTQEKLPEVWKAEEAPVPAVATVNRETVNAASARIVGNDKVPEPTYTAPEVTIDTDGTKVVNGFLQEYDNVTSKFNTDLRTIRSGIIRNRLENLQQQENLRVEYLSWQVGFREKVREYWYQLLQYAGVGKGKTANREAMQKNKKAFDTLYALVKRLNEEIKGMEVKIFDLRDDIRQL